MSQTPFPRVGSNRHKSFARVRLETIVENWGIKAARDHPVIIIKIADGYETETYTALAKDSK
jgi:hypothetical protein